MKLKRPLLWLGGFVFFVVSAVAPPPLLINEVLINPPGADDSPNEYVELRGVPNAAIPEGTYFLAVEGDAGTNAGTIQNLFDLSGHVLGGNGFLVLLQKSHTYRPHAAATVLTNSDSGPGWGSGSGSSLRHRGEDGQTELENASLTFFLIQSTDPPAIGDDIDLDDDGEIDPDILSDWLVLDSVGVLDADGAGDMAYGQINFRRKTSPGSEAKVLNGTIVPVGFTPGYVARNTNSIGWLTNDWVASDGLAGKPPVWLLGVGTNTVPASRARAALNHLGGPNFGAPAIPGVTLRQSRGSTDVSESGTNDTYTLNLNTTPRGSVTLQLLAGSQIQISTDGGLTFAPARNVAFTTTAARVIRVRAVKNDVVEPTRQAAITHTVIASADPQRYPTNTLIPTLTVTVTDDDPLLLNEVKVNPPGTNDAPWEFVELKGKPGAKLTNVFLLSVQGKAGSDPGTAETVVDLTGTQIGTNGLLMVAAVNHNYVFAPETPVLFAPQLDAPGGAFGNNTLSILLLTSPAPIQQGNDLDGGNNGTLEDLPKGARQLDAVGWTDGGTNDVVYGRVVLSLGPGTPDAAARFPRNTNANSAAAWYFGKLASDDGASLRFDKDHVSTNFPAGTVLTPGFTNNTAPVISPPFTPFSSVIGDSTNPNLLFTVRDAETAATKLIVTATNDNEAVVANSNLVVTVGVGGARTLKINPHGVGYARITVTVSDGSMMAEATFRYAASAMGRTNGHFHTGISDASTALRIDANWMLVGDDENQTVRLYSRKLSGPPVKQWDFNQFLGLTDLYPDGTPKEVDIEATTRVGNRIYWLGSHSHAYNAEERENRGRIFATDLSGTGTNVALRYVGRYEHLKADLISWDTNNLHGKGPNYYGFTNSTAHGVDPKADDGSGFNIEGLCMAPGSSTTAYLGLRAPLVPPTDRVNALIVPVLNFTKLAISNGPPGSAIFGPPIELNLGGRGIRSLDGATNNYLIVAGPPGFATFTPPSDFHLYTWNGRATNAPQQRAADLSGLLPEGIVELPSGPWTTNTQVQLISDNGITIYYGDTNQAKRLEVPNFKKFRSDWVKFGPAVVPGPIVKSIVASEGDLFITWYSVAGKKYRVEFNTDMNGTDWQPVPGDVTATGALTTKVISPAPITSCFYRVVLLP